jgi:hypothetical protein
MQGNVRKYLSNFGVVESDHMTITIFKSGPKFEIKKRDISCVLRKFEDAIEKWLSGLRYS